jgi:hypothetical protein
MVGCDAAPVVTLAELADDPALKFSATVYERQTDEYREHLVAFNFGLAHSRNARDDCPRLEGDVVATANGIPLTVYPGGLDHDACTVPRAGGGMEPPRDLGPDLVVEISDPVTTIRAVFPGFLTAPSIEVVEPAGSLVAGGTARVRWMPQDLQTAFSVGDVSLLKLDEPRMSTTVSRARDGNDFLLVVPELASWTGSTQLAIQNVRFWDDLPSECIRPGACTAERYASAAVIVDLNAK